MNYLGKRKIVKIGRNAAQSLCGSCKECIMSKNLRLISINELVKLVCRRRTSKTPFTRLSTEPGKKVKVTMMKDDQH